MSTTQYTFTLIDAEGWEVEHSLPSMFEVCPRCHGRGVHDHPAFENGLTSEDFDQDPDFREEYMRGTYDVQCSECRGLRVVSVPDEERCTAEQLAALEQHREIAFAEAQERAWERRNRSMGIEY